MAQLSAYVAEHSAYHHGEGSLASTIVNLAQDFVGSNNVNLLHPSGQFGTRLQGGKDAASARYIYTRLAALTRHLFNENDDQLLTYLNEEGQSIEPEWCVLGKEGAREGGCMWGYLPKSTKRSQNGGTCACAGGCRCKLWEHLTPQRVVPLLGRVRGVRAPCPERDNVGYQMSCALGFMSWRRTAASGFW